MSRILACLIIITFLSFSANGQPQLGFLPYTTKWQELNHDSLRIIFPEGHEYTARRVASLMLKTASVDPITRHGRYKPINVILQPHTNESNGNVRLAPYMAELTLQPHEDPFYLGSLPWADLLAITESRHVQQVNAVNTGITHLFKMIFGEEVFAGMYGLAISNWLREGDAIDAVTKWTPQGRGRLSRFMMPFKEKNRKNEFWKYYVLRNGSYKQNVPDHFPLGYMMTLYGNHVFGEATWDTIFRLTPRMSPIYDPFSGVVKKFYGKSNRFLYEAAVKYYGKIAKARAVPDIEYPSIPISEKASKRAFFDMQFPCVGGDGTIYTSITSFDSISTIYSIGTDGRRSKIISQGLQITPYFDYSNAHLVWTEKRVDPRWLRKNRNVIVLYDIQAKRKQVIATNKGYFMPSLDARAEQIVALHSDPSGQYAIHILDAQTGQLIQALPNPDNLYLGYPAFDEENQNIIATARNHEGRMCLVEQNIQSGQFRQITHYSYTVLGRHEQAGPWIYLTCGLGDLDQVYAVDRREGIFYRISGGNKAHYHPAFDPLQDNLVTSQYTNEGHKLVRLPGLPRQWVMTNLDDGIKYVPDAAERNLLIEPLGEKDFKIKKYSAWKNAINYYGLGLVVNNPNYGLELRSQNVLNTVLLAAGYHYNRNNRAGGPYFDISLGMWFPVISIGYQNTTRRPRSLDSLHLRTILDEVYAEVSVPLYFTPGVYQQTLKVSSRISSGNRKIRIIDGELFNVSEVYYAKQSAVFTNARKKAYRQPIPSWGQRIAFSYAHDISGAKINQYFASGDFALPGISASNYLLVSGNLLIQGVGLNYVQLGSDYVGARGFQLADGANNYKLGFTYGFPLIYPDIGMGNVLYVPRIRLQPFYDFAYSDSFEAASSHMSSTGAEILFDFYLSRITIGFRYARLLNGYTGDPNSYQVFIASQHF